MNSNRKTASNCGSFISDRDGGEPCGRWFGGIRYLCPLITSPPFLKMKRMLIVGVLLELVNAIAVIGIGVLMFTVLKRHNEVMATWISQPQDC